MSETAKGSLMKQGKSTKFIVTFFVSFALAKLISLAFTKIFTNILSRDEIGYYSIVISAISLVMSFSSFGIPSTLNRYAIRYKIQNKTKDLKNFVTTGIIVYLTIEAIVVLSLLIVFLVSGQGPWFLQLDNSVLFYSINELPILEISTLQTDNYISSLLVIAVIVGAQIFSTVLSTIATSLQNGRFYAVVVIMRILLQTAFALLFILYFNLGVFGLVYGLAVAEAIVAVYSIIVVLRDVGIGKFSLTELKNLLGFSLPAYYVSNLWFIFDILLLLYINFVDPIGGTTTIALYKSGALVVVNIILLAGNVFRMVYRPLTYRYFENKQFKELEDITIRVFKFFILLIFPAAMLIFAFSPLLIPMFTQSSYLDAIPLIPFLMAGIIFSYIQSIVAYGQGLYLKLYWNAIVGTFSFISSLLVAYFIVPLNGLIGIGAAFLTLRLTYLIGTAIVSRHYLKIRFEPKMILSLSAIIIGIIGIGIILYFFVFDSLGMYNIVVSFSISTVIYAILVWITKIISKDDIQFFSNLVKNYIKDLKAKNSSKASKQ